MTALRRIRDFLLTTEPVWWLEEGEKKVCVGAREGAVMGSVGRRKGPESLALPCPARSVVGPG